MSILWTLKEEWLGPVLGVWMIGGYVIINNKITSLFSSPLLSSFFFPLSSHFSLLTSHFLIFILINVIIRWWLEAMATIFFEWLTLRNKSRFLFLLILLISTISPFFPLSSLLSLSSFFSPLLSSPLLFSSPLFSAPLSSSFLFFPFSLLSWWESLWIFGDIAYTNLLARTKLVSGSHGDYFNINCILILLFYFFKYYYNMIYSKADSLGFLERCVYETTGSNSLFFLSFLFLIELHFRSLLYRKTASTKFCQLHHQTFWSKFYIFSLLIYYKIL